MNATRQTYEVDEMMCGDTWDGFDLEDFCIYLQRACDAKGLNVDIKAVTGTVNGAHNDDDHTCPDDLFWSAMSTYWDACEDSA